VRWRKEGVVLEPPTHLPWSASHAAVPVVQAQGDALRLYFTTRDDRGRSHVARARLEAGAPWEQLRVDPEPVLAPGALGTFDDAGAMTGCLVEHGGDQYLYYVGWSLGRSVPFYVYIGLAVSTDGGETFARVSPAPVLGRSAADPIFTTTPWVVVDGGRWRMWYASAAEWEPRADGARHHYRLRYAESGDGVSWEPAGADLLPERPGIYATSTPCILREDGRYRMWYSYRGESYRIGYAESGDGISWAPADGEVGIDVSPDGWDSEMIEYPSVFDFRGARQMLYNGNAYGGTGMGRATLEVRA
jgi:hypothetical protein